MDIILLIGCVLVVLPWFELTNKLSNPCQICVEEERPEIAPCFQNTIPGNEIKINFSLP